MPCPQPDADVPVMLTDRTIAQRMQKLLAQMAREGYATLIIYGDVEHSGNFEYLTGFMTRFEEGLLVLHADGRAALLVGNENIKLARHCRIPAQVLHCPMPSLPNQPMTGQRPLEELLRDAGVQLHQKTGLVGWKRFTGGDECNGKRFDLPYFMGDAIRQVAGMDAVENATGLFIGPEGVRRTNTANEIAHYAYGSALASDGVLRAMQAIRPGMRELELGGLLHAHGQRCSVTTICAAGPRYEKGNLYPSARTVALGDPVSLTCGYRGGLASRCAYAVASADQLPPSQHDYVEALSEPYFAALTAWLENFRPGMTGGELYALIQAVLPQETFRWNLCPGHLTAEEEWLCSPIYAGPAEKLLSGMLIQLDIIPSLPGYAGTGCENGIALADATLRAAIRAEYPQMWQRMQERRQYMLHYLGIRLPEWVLPLSSGVAYLRPYLLDRQRALTYNHDEEECK